MLAENKINPVLRFKNDDGGCYSDWKKETLGGLGEFKGGGTPSKLIKEFWKGNIPWVSSSDVKDGDIHNLSISRFITQNAIEESATKLIPKNSILFVSRVGVGKLVVCGKDVCTSQDFTNLVLNLTDSYFVGYYFQANKNLLLRYSQGTSIKGFTVNDIKSLKLYLPLLQEQKKIANFLSSVDTKIEQLSKKQNLLMQYKKGMMQKLFSQTIRFKADDGSNYPDLNEKFLGDIALIKTGNKDTQDRVRGGQYPFFVRSNTVERINSYSFDGEAILTAGDGVGVGKVFHYLNEKFDYHQRVYNIHNFNKNVVGKFIYCYFADRFYRRVSRLSAKNSVDSVRMDMISKMIIPLPCYQEQQKIANFLSSIDKKIEQTNNQITQTKQFKKALLQQMFV
jgi:type I restriction enzyme S subunit